MLGVCIRSLRQGELYVSYWLSTASYIPINGALIRVLSRFIH